MTDRPLANEIVPIQAAKDEYRRERYYLRSEQYLYVPHFLSKGLIERFFSPYHKSIIIKDPYRSFVKKGGRIESLDVKNGVL